MGNVGKWGTALPGRIAVTTTVPAPPSAPVWRITVPGKAVAKGRPRATKGGRLYTPKQTVTAESWVRLCCTQQVGAPCLQGAVRVRIEVVVPWPAEKRARRDAERGGKQPGRPDLDNTVKLALDALNGIAWADDAGIVSLQAVKRWGDAGCMVVEWQAAPDGAVGGLL